MSSINSKPQTLRTLWISALVIGAVVFAVAIVWLQSSDGPGLDFVWAIAAFGAAAIATNVAFFTLCSVFAPSLADVVTDDTEIKGDDVVHVVRHAETGDATTDFYIRAYAAARGTTAVAIGAAVMITLALWFF